MSRTTSQDSHLNEFVFTNLSSTNLSSTNLTATATTEVIERSSEESYEIITNFKHNEIITKDDFSVGDETAGKFLNLSLTFVVANICHQYRVLFIPAFSFLMRTR